MPKGFIVHEGKSRLGDKDIVGIITLKSSNVKTGNMAQLWILVKDQHPLEAIKTKDDKAICGTCPHRRATGGACYVNVGQAPAQIWKAYQKGAYKHASLNEIRPYMLNIRFGAYGDPLALPIKFIKTLKDSVKSWTGYTHQIQTVKSTRRKGLGFLMVSSDSEEQTVRYNEQGMRTFRVKKPEQRRLKVMNNYEVHCPADLSKNKVQCESCRLCGDKMKHNVVIDVHGTLKGRFTK